MSKDPSRPNRAFDSLATTAEGVFSDLLRHGQNILKDLGVLPATHGVTKHVPQPKPSNLGVPLPGRKPEFAGDGTVIPKRKPDDLGPNAPVDLNKKERGQPVNLMGSLDAFIGDAVKQKGPRALDHPTDPADTYRHRRYSFLKEHEGVRSRAYDDATGHPVRAGAKTEGLVTVGIGFNMERKDARAVWTRSGMTKSFDAVFAGEEKLNGAEIKRLFDHTIQEAEDFVANRFRGVDLKEHERIALVSLAFNNPELIGPNLTRQIREGRMDAAREEILWRSNLKKHKGLANRRWHEAAMFVGRADAGRQLPIYSEYMKNFG